MKVLLLGARGQLGQTLEFTKPKQINLISLTSDELNFLKLKESKKLVEEINPEIILNAAAYTNVDKSETENKAANDVNAYAPYEIASKLDKFGCKFIQISSDFVFNGTQSFPYKPSDLVSPLGEYGKSKALGEKLLLQLENIKVIRTSWLYSPYGRNFCLTMLYLLKKNYEEKKKVKVIYDQISCPTSTFSLSNLCWDLILNREVYKNSQKIIHWSDAGVASWYDFAIAIGEIAKQEKLIETLPEIIPIKSREFTSAANRPHFSLLDCDEISKLSNVKRVHWRAELESVIKQIKNLKIN